jgi:hypothetical protein
MDNFPIDEDDELSQGERDEVVGRFQIDSGTLDAFLDYVAAEGLSLPEDEVEKNREVIRNLLSQEVLLLLVGDEASYRIALELDSQVRAAIDLLPKALSLLDASSKEDPSLGS